LNKRAGARDLREAAEYNSWMHRYFFPPRCLTCTDLTAQLADISFGDPWLPRFTRTDSIGLSMIVARSAIGLRFLELAIRDRAIQVVDELSQQEIADSQEKLPHKVNTRPYRIAASWLRIKTPDYGSLYAGGKATPAMVLGAAWEYARLWLGRHPRLWPALVSLERMSLARVLWAGRWRGRLRRMRGRVTRLAGWSTGFIRRGNGRERFADTSDLKDSHLPLATPTARAGHIAAAGNTRSAADAD
jgi:hypothetical protein